MRLAFLAAALGLTAVTVGTGPAGAQTAGRGKTAAPTRSTSTATSASATSTTGTDPDVGRRLAVNTGDPLGHVFSSGPAWIGAVFALGALAGIAYALLPNLPGRSAGRRWPRRH